MERCVEGILECRFEPAPGKHCVRCDYSRLCDTANPKGRPVFQRHSDSQPETAEFPTGIGTG